MSIWVSKDELTREIAEQIYKDCTIIEKISWYKQSKGGIPIRVLMFCKDESKMYYQIPYYVARKHGFEPRNNLWRQVIFEQTDEQGNKKYMPEFNAQFREYQLDILDEILTYLRIHNTVTLGLPPGFGKTIITAYLFWLSGLLGIFIMDRNTVKDGTITTFRKTMPNLKLWIVGENNPTEYDLIICMNERLHQIPHNVKMQIGFFCIDEVHKITTPTQVRTFLDFQPKYIVFLSATLEQSSLYEMAVSCAGPHGCFKTSTTPYYIFAVQTGITGEEEYRNGTKINAVTQKSLVNNEIRKRIIQMIIYNHIEFRKFIVMQRVTDGIEYLVENLKNCGITADSLYSTKRDYIQSQVLVGTYSKISTGFDEENACSTYYTNPDKSNTALFINSIASKYVFEQSRMRCRCSDKGLEAKDDNPNKIVQWVIMLIDENRSVKSNFDGLKPWFRETNGTVVDVDARKLFTEPTQIKYIPFHMEGIYYRLISDEDYNSLYRLGFYCGTPQERERKILYLYKIESVMHYKQQLFPNVQCYILTIQKCLLYVQNDLIVENEGIVFCKHPIFLKNIVGAALM